MRAREREKCLCVRGFIRSFDSVRGRPEIAVCISVRIRGRRRLFHVVLDLPRGVGDHWIGLSGRHTAGGRVRTQLRVAEITIISTHLSRSY